MNKFIKLLKEKDVGAIGIGAMIVFIAMVLVAGIAASVLIQTSTRLESQAMQTGEETTAEVSTGIAVFDIEGRKGNGTSVIQNLVVMVRPRAGSRDIDLSTTVIELSDGTNKYILNYSQSHFRGAPNVAGIFYTPVFGTLSADDFGIIELKDVDSSCAAATPVINRGDKVLLAINTTTTFSSSGGLEVRKDIFGRVVTEEGAAGIIAFTTPSSYSDVVYDLQ